MMRSRANRGNMMIQGLIFIAIVGAIFSILSPMFSVLFRNQKNILNQIEYASLEYTVADILSQIQNCSCQVQGLVFNSNDSAATVSLNSMKLSCAPGASDLMRTHASFGNTSTASGGKPPIAMMDYIHLAEFRPTAVADEYTAVFLAGWPTDLGMRAIKPTPIPVLVHTDPNSPVNAKVIQGCGHAPPSTPTGIHAIPLVAGCDLSWAPSTGASPILYNVRQSMTAGSAVNGQIVCSGSTTGCSVTSLASGVPSYFTIQAVNAVQASAYSPEVQCIPQ